MESPEAREQAQLISSLLRRVQRLESRRPLRGGSPDLSWGIAGPLDATVKFPWLWVSIDPAGEGAYPEDKRIIGFEGRIDSGQVEVYWTVNDEPIDESSQTIDSTLENNRLDLPTPYRFAPDALGAWLRPVFYSVFGTDDDVMLSCLPIFEVVAV